MEEYIPAPEVRRESFARLQRAATSLHFEPDVSRPATFFVPLRGKGAPTKLRRAAGQRPVASFIMWRARMTEARPLDGHERNLTGSTLAARITRRSHLRP